jgi:hypothetical protein
MISIKDINEAIERQNETSELLTEPVRGVLETVSGDLARSIAIDYKSFIEASMTLGTIVQSSLISLAILWTVIMYLRNDNATPRDLTKSLRLLGIDYVLILILIQATPILFQFLSDFSHAIFKYYQFDAYINQFSYEFSEELKQDQELSLLRFNVNALTTAVVRVVTGIANEFLGYFRYYSLVFLHFISPLLFGLSYFHFFRKLSLVVILTTFQVYCWPIISAIINLTTMVTLRKSGLATNKIFAVIESVPLLLVHFTFTVGVSTLAAMFFMGADLSVLVNRASHFSQLLKNLVPSNSNGKGQ